MPAIATTSVLTSELSDTGTVADLVSVDSGSNLDICEFTYSLFVWDRKRTFDMGTVRSLLVAPFLFFWYRALNKIVIGGRIANLFGRLFIDQTVGGPIVIALVFSGNHLLQWPDFSVQRTCTDLAERGLSTWLKGLQYNPFVNCLNFAFIPLPYQPLVAHCTAIYWTAILSYYSNMGLR
jgi:hypothetical protein